MLACIPAFLFEDKKIILFINTALASLAAATITLGTIIVTAASSIAAKAINKVGERITLVATKGTKFYTISWIASIFMIISSLFWMGKFAMVRKVEKRNRERFSKERY